MQNNKSAGEDLFNELFSDLLLCDDEDTKTDDCDTLTLWIPKAKKAKYAKLQARTNRRFSKRLKKLIVAAIDRMPDDDKAA